MTQHKALGPCRAPVGAYDAPFQYARETDALITRLCEQHGTTAEEVEALAYRCFPKDKGLLISLVMYRRLLSLSESVDTATAFRPSTGYQDLAHSAPVCGAKLAACAHPRERISAWLESGLLSLQQSTPPLFGRVEVELSYESIGEMFGDEEEIESRGSVRKTRVSEKRRSSALVKKPEEEEASMKTMLSAFKSESNYHFSSSLFSPPPISLLDSLPFESPSPETALVVDFWAELYEAQCLYNALYFVLKRLSDLWTKPTGRALPVAPFRVGERKLLRSLLMNLTGPLAGLWITSVLGSEGFGMGGDSFVKALQSGRAVVDIQDALKSQLGLCRDACLCIDRLRASVLYGPAHRSYVGDGFLTSCLETHKAGAESGAAFEDLIALMSPITMLALPEEGEKSHDAFERFCDSLPERTKHEGLLEKGVRQQ